jgi:signal transduction histidine kinase
VRLAETNGHVVLQVTDNGRGISEVESHNMKSIGLLGIRERAGLLGGTLRIKGARGKGTTLTARIPKALAARARSHSHENPHH